MLLLATWPAAAQFTPSYNGPVSLKWNHIVTESYDVVYPRGLDSLGMAYATMLERVKEPVSRSIGFVPNQFGRRPFPVILFTADAYSNGNVTWTPHRMELITMPEADAPLPLPWIEQLTTHESRHAAQMQYLQAPRHRIWKILTGELFGGALAALYCGPQFFEGDAVVAETELSLSGRGRSADFLEYYRVCFDAGDMRNYWQWRWGSQMLNTPDYYALGYVTMAGIRGLYDEPLLTKRYFDKLLEGHGYPLSVWNKTVKDVTGKKFKEVFPEICDTLGTRWRRDMEARGPFMPMTQLGETPRRYTENTDNCYLHEHVFDIHAGLCETPTLMLTNPDGRGERRVSRFSYSGIGMKPDPVRERLYWSETVPDLRWTDRSWSEIHYCHHDGLHHRLTRHTRYYNPAPSPDGSEIAVTEYREDGTSAALVIDPDDGHVIRSFPAPAGMQVTEVEWADNMLFAAAISEEGIGIYEVESWTPVLKPQFSGIKELWHHDGHIYYTSDRSGVNELYSVCMETGQELQLTSTPYGASEFQFNDATDTLYYSAPTPQGRLLFSTPVDSLTIREVPEYSPKEPELLAAVPASRIDKSAPVEISAPAPYSRVGHLMRFHSWMPFYFDFDDVADLSFETVYNSAGLGATAFFQNLLGTMDGSVGYKAAPNDGHWFHSGHVKFTYRGLYPIIEASGSFGDRYSYDYFNSRIIENGENKDGMVHSPTGRLSWNANIRTYIPFVLSSGGWERGIVPQLSYGITGDRFSSDLLRITHIPKEPTHPKGSQQETDGEKEEPEYDEKVERFGRGTYVPLSRLGASIRGYCMLPTAHSCIYPKLGIGAELGYSLRPGAITMDAKNMREKQMFNSNVYAFVYGYLPGFAPDHGFRFSTVYQQSLGDSVYGEAYAATAPRGFGISSLMSERGYGSQAKLSIDYAAPFLSVDWGGMCPVAYVRNFEAQPHFDISLYGGSPKLPSGNLFSAGLDLSVCLGNFLWVPYLTRVGVSWSFNGGSLYDYVSSKDDSVSRNYFGFIFEIDL